MHIVSFCYWQIQIPYKNVFFFLVDDITEDRMLALRKRAEVDSKYIITFSPNDAYELKQSLQRYVISSLYRVM